MQGTLFCHIDIRTVCLTRTDAHFPPAILEMGYIQLTIAKSIHATEIQVSHLPHSHERSHSHFSFISLTERYD
jgi:hypothetical protein